jgi:hypothetical protein
MKKEANFNLIELDNLYPYEFEIYYWMTVKDLKDRIEANRK